MENVKVKRKEALLNENHIRIMRFLLNEFNNVSKRYKINAIAKEIGKQPTETKRWLFYLKDCKLIYLEEKKVNKSKRYAVYITRDKKTNIEILLGIFEKFCK